MICVGTSLGRGNIHFHPRAKIPWVWSKGVILRRVCFAEAHGALAKGQPNLGTCPNEGHGPIDAGCTGGKGSRPLGFATPSSEAEVNLPLDVQDVLEESMLRGQSEKREEATGWPGECWPTVLSLETGVW